MRVRPERVRRGVVNVLFAMMFFVIFALAALIVDLGMVRHTQRVMQSAADSAAIEGLREGVPINANNRAMATEWTTNAFADGDAGASRTISNGAGPTFELTGGIGPEGLNAAQLIRPGTPYKPALQANPGNATSGDIVAGTYAPTEYAGRAENNDYSRNDGFVPEANGNALLVRLRRTDPDRDPLAREADVSSSGPPLPLLFGRGTTIRVTDPTAEYNPRVHGFTVRATAIAQATPVRTVGPPVPSAGIEGLTPIALRLNTWQTMGETWVMLDAATVASDTPAARIIDNSRGSIVGLAATGIALTLQPVTDPASVPPTAGNDLSSVYVPIFDTVAGATGDWIVGFGIVQVSGSAPRYVRRRAGGLRFPTDGGFRSGERFRNLSATVVQSAALTLNAAAPLDAIFRANESLYRDPVTKQPNATTGGLVLLAPALVR